MSSSTVPVLISEQVAELGAANAKRLPPEVRAVFGQQARALAQAGVPAAVARPGRVLEDVRLLDAHGAPTSLHQVTGGRPSVLVFYRGAWCPYCNLALRTYQQHLLPELTKRGAVLVAISPQKPDGSLSMQEKNELAFPVLSDPGNTLAAALGFLMPVRSAEVRGAQEQLGLKLEDVNADGTDALAMAATIVADAANTIRWIDVQPVFTVRSEVADILDALDAVL